VQQGNELPWFFFSVGSYGVLFFFFATLRCSAAAESWKHGSAARSEVLSIINPCATLHLPSLLSVCLQAAGCC
jgi:hypothetical protein